jgi:hypothetical protein
MAVLLNKADLLSEEQVQELKEWYTTHCRAEQVRARCVLAGALGCSCLAGAACVCVCVCARVSCTPPSH